MTLTPRTLLFAAAAICFTITLLLALGAFNGSNQTAWEAGGLLAVTLGLLSPK